MTLQPIPLRKTVAMVVLLCAALALAARPAAAQDVTWTVATADNHYGSGRDEYRYTINPGAEVDDGIVITNQGDTELQLTIAAAEAFTTPDGELGYRSDGAKGLAGWVALSGDAVTVKPRETVQLPFKITLPSDAEPGDYVGGIVTTGGDAELQASIPIRLRVGGALKPSLAVENIDLDYGGTANPVGKGDATVSYTIRNTGNAILAAKPKVSVSGPFGLWKVETDELPNTPQLLPGESWEESASLSGVVPAMRLAATITLTPLLIDAAGSTAPLTPIDTAGHAFALPWTLLLIVVAAGVLVAIAVRLPRRRATTVAG